MLRLIYSWFWEEQNFSGRSFCRLTRYSFIWIFTCQYIESSPCFNGETPGHFPLLNLFWFIHLNVKWAGRHHLKKNKKLITFFFYTANFCYHTDIWQDDCIKLLAYFSPCLKFDYGFTLDVNEHKMLLQMMLF